MKKICKDCGKEKEIGLFYKHKAMAGGTLNACIECVKKRVSKHRNKNIEYIRNYDKQRKKKKNMTEEQILKIKKYAKDYQEENRAKKYCHVLLNRAVKKGLIKTSNVCEDCGCEKNNLSEIQGHHEDYFKPLEVIWLCRVCHSRRHKK